jgi:hypothetical protein
MNQRSLPVTEHHVLKTGKGEEILLPVDWRDLSRPHES